jgi:hypothetical protein
MAGGGLALDLQDPQPKPVVLGGEPGNGAVKPLVGEQARGGGRPAGLMQAEQGIQLGLEVLPPLDQPVPDGVLAGQLSGSPPDLLPEVGAPLPQKALPASGPNRSTGLPSKERDTSTQHRAPVLVRRGPARPAARPSATPPAPDAAPWPPAAGRRCAQMGPSSSPTLCPRNRTTRRGRVCHRYIGRMPTSRPLDRTTVTISCRPRAKWSHQVDSHSQVLKMLRLRAASSVHSERSGPIARHRLQFELARHRDLLSPPSGRARGPAGAGEAPRFVVYEITASPKAVRVRSNHIASREL